MSELELPGTQQAILSWNLRENRCVEGLNCGKPMPLWIHVCLASVSMLFWKKVNPLPWTRLCESCLFRLRLDTQNVPQHGFRKT